MNIKAISSADEIVSRGSIIVLCSSKYALESFLKDLSNKNHVEINIDIEYNCIRMEYHGNRSFSIEGLLSRENYIMCYDEYFYASTYYEFILSTEAI